MRQQYPNYKFKIGDIVRYRDYEEKFKVIEQEGEFVKAVGFADGDIFHYTKHNFSIYN